mgnify:CR=1 FL=1
MKTNRDMNPQSDRNVPICSEGRLLEASDWSGEWISAPRVDDWDAYVQWARVLPKDAPKEVHEAAPYLRKSFVIEKSIQKARAHVCGLGYGVFFLNGRRVGDRVLDPAFTNYDKRVLYSTYEVTELLEEGRNAMGMWLGDGWYNSHARAVWGFDRAPWRDRPCCRLQLEVEYEDGTRERFVTDGSWKSRSSPVVYNSIREGEIYDARKEIPGWSEGGLDDRDWAPVLIVGGPKGVLQPQELPPIRICEKLRPVGFTEPKPGLFVFDFGQNFAGWVQLRVRGEAGDRVVMKFGEQLHADGTLDQSNIDRHHRNPRFHYAEYILKGGGEEVWHPEFTYFGFQYVEVTGLREPPTTEMLEGHFVHTDFEEVGGIVCSDPMIQRVVSATRWSYLSNFHGYPTDCPQREKNGWTGDAHLGAETGLLLFRPEAAYRKWLEDCRDAQLETGALPAIVPTSGWGYRSRTGFGGNIDLSHGFGPAWDGAYLWVAWYLYLYTGDVDVLDQHYEGLVCLVDYLGSFTEDGLLGIGLGDWVFYRTWTPAPLTSTACLYDLTEKLGRIAGILGKEADAERYWEEAARIRAAFNREYYDPQTHTYHEGEQTGMAAALYFNLVPKGEEARVAARLSSAIEANDGLLDCGVLGAKWIPHALSRHGYTQQMMDILRDTRCPGWGYWMDRGATTLWEDFKPTSADNSRNHMFFGDIVHWLFEAVAGIRPDPDHPGFRKIRLKPDPVRPLDCFSAQTGTVVGPLSSGWERSSGGVEYHFTISPETRAEVDLPMDRITRITVDGMALEPSQRVEAAGGCLGLSPGDWRVLVRD